MAGPTVTSFGTAAWTNATVSGSVSGASWNAGDMIMFFAYNTDQATSHDITNTPSNANLTFIHKDHQHASIGSWDLWYAIAGSNQSSQTLGSSASEGGSQHQGKGVWVKIASPMGPNYFDPNSLSFAFGGTGKAITFSTSFPNTTILSFVGWGPTAATVTAPGGSWTETARSASGSSAVGVVCETQAFSAVQSGTTITYGGTNPSESIYVVGVTADRLAWIANNGSAATGTSATTAMPSGIVAGDLLIAEIIVAASKTIATSTTGWTIISQATESGYTYAVAWKKAVGSDTTPTFTWDGTSQTYAANCTNWRGAWTGGPPIGASSVAVGTGTTAGQSAITAQMPFSTIVNLQGTSVSQTISVPTNFNSKSNFSGGSNPGAAERMSSRDLTNAGDSSGASTVTITSANWGNALFEVYTQLPVFTSTVDQTFPLIVQEIDCTETAPSSDDGPIAMTLGQATQALVATESEPSTIAMQFAIPSLTQEIDIFATNGIAAQTLFNITQDFEALDSPNSDIDMTLFNISQTITDFEELPTQIDMTLSGIVQEALVSQEIETGVITTLAFPIEQDWEGLVGLGAQIHMDLPGILQELIGVRETEITQIDMTFFNIQIQQFDVFQTPPLIIAQEIPGALALDVEVMETEEGVIDMTFVDIAHFPRFTDIDMTLGGGICPGITTSRSGWWPGD